MLLVEDIKEGQRMATSCLLKANKLNIWGLKGMS
ncbi:MAG: hypothetical protein CM15mV136_250 [Caudoviricetes sp.]|nr:MAG: hypothetical protein CM15mV136_250 [Caudoviricetes sp.]